MNAFPAQTNSGTRRLRVRLAQIKVEPGQPATNTAIILEAVQSARTAGIDLIVFPEMAIPGYLIGDCWERDAFLRDCAACGERLREAARDIIVVFGNVGLDWQRRNEDGRTRKYNALFIAANGKFAAPPNSPYNFVVKTLLPNYREFEDSRHFYDLRRLAAEEGRTLEQLLTPVQVASLSLGCILCEDAWDMDYNVSPLALLARHNPDIIINASCSPFTLHKNLKRQRVFAEHARRLKKPILYVNNVGIQNNGKTIFVFDGDSRVYDARGHSLMLPNRFEPGMLDCAMELDQPVFAAPAKQHPDGTAEICQALLAGASQFMQQCGIERVVVGISGGIDSAVAAALYRCILPPANLLLVNMPSRFNSPTTINLARNLARNLGCYYTELPIQESVNHTVAQLDKLSVSSPDQKLRTMLALDENMRENVQSRDRAARLLAALASAFQGVFSCNANKAEATVGYTTLYGDLCGFMAILGDLWKSEVYALGRHLNEEVFRRETIPEGSFTVTPSAELSPLQNVDQGLGDPLNYPYHEKLFAAWVEAWRRLSPEEILEAWLAGKLEEQLGYNDGKLTALFGTPAQFIADLERWWKLYCGLGTAKRIQAPPVLAIKKRAFGFDHREAQMQPWFSQRYQELKAQILARLTPIPAGQFPPAHLQSDRLPPHPSPQP